jgi:hypothetical protein
LGWSWRPGTIDVGLSSGNEDVFVAATTSGEHAELRLYGVKSSLPVETLESALGTAIVETRDGWTSSRGELVVRQT